MTNKTVERLEELLRACLAGDPLERRIADIGLTLHFDDEGNASDETGPLVDEATARLGDEREPFLRALVQFWAGITAVSAGVGSTGKTNWRQWAKPAGYPLTESTDIGDWEAYGDGIGRYLRNRRAELGFLLPLFLSCTRHPIREVQDIASVVLGAHPADAKPAFGPLLDLAFREGRMGSDVVWDTLAKLVDAHPEFLGDLIAAINVPFVGHRIAVVSIIANRLKLDAPRLYHAFLDRLRRKVDLNDRQSLVFAAARWSSRNGRVRADELVSLAEAMRLSKDPQERAIAAGIVALLVSAEEGEGLLIAALNGTDPEEAITAVNAAAQLSTPSQDLVEAVARHLGSDALGRTVHRMTIAALANWGPRAGAAAVRHVERWLGEDADIRPKQIFLLLGFLGEPAHALHDAVAAFIDRQPVVANDQEDPDQFDVDDDAFDIDDDHDHEDAAEQTEAIDRLRAWVTKARAGITTP